MLLQRNLLECVTIISCSGTIICVLLNCFTNISPITGVWLTVYFITLFIVSIIFSFKFIQWLLQLNKPIKYDLEGLLKDYPQLSFLALYLPQTRKVKRDEGNKEYDTNELSVISTVLEKKLVSSWYVPYISQEIGFPFSCKQMLDQMIGKTFQICNNIETKDVYVDVCAILVTHLKEYKKALKRHEKSPNDSIESLYKKSHPVFSTTNKTDQSAEHCTDIIRIMLKELVSWELRDTPHLELLARILSKKFDDFINSTLADPVWLNHRIMTILKGKEPPKTDDLKPEQVKEDVKEVNEVITEVKPETTTIESALSTLITKSTAPILQRAINEDYIEDQNEKLQDIIEEVPVTSSEPVDIKASPILRQRRGRQGRNEVKIYDRIIEGSVKTWETDLDLQCISLGQDLLASLDGEITLSRLWGQDTETDGSPNPQRRKSPQPLWFGEDDALDMEFADTSPQKERSPVKKEHSPKAADALLKDLQSTVNQAKTKIGDLQVTHTTKVDVTCKRSSDEAAGMMEGLLDFGIAGLKKGLRFTGLSDDSQQEKSPFHKDRSGEKISPAELTKMDRVKAGLEQKDIITSTVIQREDNGSTTAPPLLKQQRVISQDSVPSQPRPILKGEIPPPLVPLSDSPEPEYEEAADLSTSIAKLRCLLQQRAEANPRGDDIWLEGVEETRGHTHHHHSSRPVDTATLADEYDLAVDRNASPGQTSINMQRLDKLFQRTVTGMFNSLKTAVGGEGGVGGEGPEGEGAGEPPAAPHWTYVCTSVELSVGGAVARLVGSRRAHAHVDAALDSLQLAPSRDPATPDPAPIDFEECVWYSCRAWSCAEAAAAVGLLRSHVAHRLAALLCADLAETLINSWLEDVGPWLRQQVFLVFQNMAEHSSDTFVKEKEKLRELNVDETAAAILEKLPVLCVFGEETLTNATRLVVSSFSHKEVNRDLAYRLLDILALHFKRSAALRNPSLDAN